MNRVEPSQDLRPGASSMAIVDLAGGAAREEVIKGAG